MSEKTDDTTLDMEPADVVIPRHDPARMTPAQQAALDAARTQARASADASDQVNGTAGSVLVVGSTYKARLLHNMLVQAYTRGASFGAQLALERLVSADDEQRAALEAETAEAERAKERAVEPSAAELERALAPQFGMCEGVTSIDGKCTVCGMPWTTLTHKGGTTPDVDPSGGDR